MTIEAISEPEAWRPVPRYEGLYEVSDLGRVRSLDRWVTTANRWGTTTRYHRPGRVLAWKLKTVKEGYQYAYVSLSRDGAIETCAVHRLVLEAFTGPCPPEQQSRHLDGASLNNRRTNLAWGTVSENMLDKVRHGTHHKVAQTDCPWGHELAAPNLEPSQVKRGFRRCWACAATQMWGRNLGLRPGDERWLAEAHRRYAEILHFGLPLNYRLKANWRHNGTRWTPGAPGPWKV